LFILSAGLLSTYYVSGAVLGLGGTMMDKTHQVTSFVELGEIGNMKMYKDTLFGQSGIIHL
jgi:hypothetical protein